MIQKLLTITLAALMLVGGIAFGPVSVWAGDLPPIETTRNFDNGKIKVEFDQYSGTPVKVEIDGVQVTPVKRWICLGDPLDGKCYLIKNAGPKDSGCVIYANPRTYIYGGDSYSR